MSEGWNMEARSEARLRLMESILGNANDAVIITEADPMDEPGPRIVYVNEAFTRMTGYAPEEIIGKTPRILQGAGTDREKLDEIRTALAKKEPIRTELLNYREDGTEFWVELDIVPMSGDDEWSDHWLSVQRETTERVRAETTRHESERRLRSILAQYESDMITILDPDGTPIYESPQIENTLGYHHRELAGEDPYRHIHPDDSERLADAVARTLRTSGINPPVEYRIRHADGSWRHFESISNNLSHDPEVGGIVVNTRDITERRRAEEILEQSEAKFRAVFDRAATGMALVSEDGRLIESNPALQEMLGYTDEELRGMHFADVTHPEDVEEDRALFEELMGGRRDHFRLEKRYLRKDGGLRWGRLTSSVIREESGECRFMIGMVEDVTERRRAEEKQRESEQRYRALMEQSVETIYLYDAETKQVLESNEAFQRMMGYTAEELRGVRIYDLIAHDPEDIDRRIRHTLEVGGQHIGERNYRRKDGSIVVVETSSSVVPYGDRTAICAVSRDVTELKEAREKLEESERRFRSLIQNAPDAISVLDSDSTILYDSPAIERLLGYTPEERVGKKGFDYVHPEDLETARRTLDEVLENPGVRMPVEYRLRRKDGSWRCFEAARTNLLDDPSVGGIVLNYRDVTERKQAEDDLARERNLLRTVIDSARDGIFVKDREHRFILNNRAHQEIHGASSQEELLGKTNADLWGDERAAPHHADDQRVIETGEPLVGREEIIYLHSGEQLWWSTTKVPLRGPDGEVEGVVVVGRDVTERRRAAEALKESEERFRAVIEQTIDGIYLGDVEERRIIDSNTAFQRILGYTDEELLGMHLYDFVAHPREDIDSIYQSTLDQGHLFIGDRRYRRKDGSEIAVESSATVISHGGRRVMCTIVRDITERRRAEQALRENEELLRAVTSGAPVILFALDREGTITLSEGKGLASVGERSGGIVGLSIFEYCQHDPEVVQNVRRALEGEDVAAMVELGGLAFETRYSPTRDSEGGVTGVIGIATDVTERRKLEKELEHRAFHDPLTDLPNRALFMDRLTHALERRQESVAVLFLDLDGFKTVNDRFGHERGDALLVAVAERLRGCLRPADTVSRFGGDEFVVLLESATREGSGEVAIRISEALRAPFALGEAGNESSLTVSVGIAHGTAAHQSPAEFLQAADRAMYEAKIAGKDGYRYYRR